MFKSFRAFPSLVKLECAPGSVAKMSGRNGGWGYPKKKYKAEWEAKRKAYEYERIGRCMRVGSLP